MNTKEVITLGCVVYELCEDGLEAKWVSKYQGEVNSGI